jgi:hypothetical protein
MVVKMTVTGIHNSLLIAYAPIATSLQLIRYYAVVVISPIITPALIYNL